MKIIYLYQQTIITEVIWSHILIWTHLVPIVGEFSQNPKLLSTLKHVIWDLRVKFETNLSFLSRYLNNIMMYGHTATASMFRF